MRVGLLALAQVWASGCSPAPEAVDLDRLATWNGGEIRRAQLDERVRSLPAARRQPAAGESLAEWTEERIVDVALSEILLERAESSPLADAPDLALRARYLAGQEMGRRYLASACPVVEVSEEELRELFAQLAPREPRPWILLRHIYKRAEAGAADRSRVRQELEGLRREVQDGASFLELARRHSDSKTAEDSGLIGRISRDAPMETQVLDAAWKLEDGELSEVVEVKNGFHLLLRESSGVEPVPDHETLRSHLAEQESLRRRELCGQETLRRLAEEMPARIEADILDPASPETEVLWIGEEAFTSAQLAGIPGDGQPLALSPRPRGLVRHFVESMLLSRAFAAESEPQAAQLEEIVQRTRRQLLIEGRWEEERVVQVASRGEEALRRAFAEQPERFSSDLVLDVGLILVRSDTLGQRREVFEKTLALRRRIEAGESFADVAKAESSHHSAAEGGRLGPLPLPRLRIVLGSEGTAKVTSLPVGEVSDPVRIQDAPAAAYALLEVYGREEPAPRSFEEARADVIETLARDRVRQLDAEVRERILDEVGWQLHPAAVAEYLAGSGSPPEQATGRAGS